MKVKTKALSMSKLDNFLQALNDNGDMFFTTGSKKGDMQIIEQTIGDQGYWAGNKLRYFFDKDFNLIWTEERPFGS